MMIEKLAAAIDEKTKTFVRYYDLLGTKDPLTLRAHAELEGMKEAFEIIAGETHFEYWCRLHGV